MISITHEIPDVHGNAIEALFDATFGPGHFAKTAERVREYSTSIPELTRVALKDDKLVGVCRVWPISIGETPALFFGPIAVSPECQGEAIGGAVTQASLQAAKEAGWTFGCLIGDPKYFCRFGFEIAEIGQVQMPGPQDLARVMLIRLAVSPDQPLPAGRVTFPRDARRAEATQIRYLQRAKAEG